MLQCRFTVAGESSSAAAVSSMVMPVKIRHSTTRTAWGATESSRPSASFSASTSSIRVLGRERVVVQLDRDRAAAALLRVARHRVVDQDVTHRARRHREEMRAVLPRDVIQANELEVRLVRERGGAQRVAGPFVPQRAVRQTAQRVVDQRHEPVERLPVAAAGFAEQACDARRVSHIRTWERRRPILRSNPPILAATR